MRRLWQRIRSDERGLSLIELVISGVITALISVTAMAWVTSAGRADQMLEGQTDTIDMLRAAKSELVRESRYARAVYPLLAESDDELVLWVDEDRSGGAGPDTGELITWRIQSDGVLVRLVDGLAPAIKATGLVTDDSSLQYDASTKTVAVVLAVLGDEGMERIETTVQVRNA